MLFVVSPAKSLDFESASLLDVHTNPEFVDEASQLVGVLKKMSSQDVQSLMGVSEKIAELNVERFNSWTKQFTPANSKQAIYAFKGDVYTGIGVASCDQEQVDYFQKHLRILSGLYGLLKPLDLMQAYRLEMGTKLETPDGKGLYQFWGDKLTDRLNLELDLEEGAVLVNLASNEYFKSIKPKKIHARIVTPIFKDLKNGSYKIVSFYAKKARGLMVRYAADRKVTDVEALKGFDYEGYAFNESMSTADDWVFTRDNVPGK